MVGAVPLLKGVSTVTKKKRDNHYHRKWLMGLLLSVLLASAWTLGNGVLIFQGYANEVESLSS